MNLYSVCSQEYFDSLSPNLQKIIDAISHINLVVHFWNDQAVIPHLDAIFEGFMSPEFTPFPFNMEDEILDELLNKINIIEKEWYEIEAKLTAFVAEHYRLPIPKTDKDRKKLHAKLLRDINRVVIFSPVWAETAEGKELAVQAKKLFKEGLEIVNLMVKRVDEIHQSREIN